MVIRLRGVPAPGTGWRSDNIESTGRVDSCITNGLFTINNSSTNSSGSNINLCKYQMYFTIRTIDQLSLFIKNNKL